MDVKLHILTVDMFPVNSSKIRDLWLDNTNLTALEDKVFYRMTNLNRLSLSNNYLSQLHPLLFSKLLSLKYLDLSNNCLMSPLDNRLFSSLKQLRYLKLDFNKLTSLDANILTPLANNSKGITLSNNPFICNCSIRDAVEWFKNHSLDPKATCRYPIAGKEWRSLTGPYECLPSPNIDLTCNVLTRSLEKIQGEKSSDSFPLTLVLVVALCGCLLLLCGGLSVYCWRRTTKNTTSNLERKDNENKYYDDVRPNDYYYYETIRAQVPRYLSCISSSRPGSAPELPKRPEVLRSELHALREFKEYDDVLNVRNRESDTDSYINPETNASGERKSRSDKVPASRRSFADSEVFGDSGETHNLTEKFDIRKPLQEAQLQAGASGKQEDITASLKSELVTSISGLRHDESGIVKVNNIHAQDPEYPWNRDSFWKS
jgi:hypothetical protein